MSYNGNLLTENRHGRIVTTEVLQANGTAERDAALLMLEQIPGGRITVGTDKGYDINQAPYYRAGVATIARHNVWAACEPEK